MAEEEKVSSENQPVDNKKTTKKEEQNRITEEQVTIMPTMIDDSEDRMEKKMDLSAIIPKSVQESSENSISLTSRDAELKGDGSVSIGTINVDGEITMSPNAAFPEQIDVEERKKIAQKNKGIFKKEKKKKSNKNAQRFQNRTALLSLLVIIGLIGFVYWVKTKPTDKDFKPLPVEVELGDALPKETSNYVKPGIGNEVDDLQYSIDLSKVKVDEVGEYEFTVKHNGITKRGTVVVKDTTPPELETREVKITEGASINAAQFVAKCSDYSGCNYSFKEIDTETKYTSVGTHVVYVVATDAFQNSTTKTASLIIESDGIVKKYVKYYEFDFKAGYEKEERYELTFKQYDTYAALLRGTYKEIYHYDDENKFKEAAKTYSGETGYTIDEAKTSITFTKSVTTIGSNYTNLDDIEEYLRKEHYQFK